MILETHDSSGFRDQARAWLTLHPAAAGSKPQIVTAGSRKAVIAEFVDCPANYVFTELLLVRGDFQCGPGCRFEAPVYVGGRCIVGKDSRFAALCVERECVLGLGAQVRDWVDARGPLDLRAGAWVAGIAVSDTSIQLSVDSGASQLFAPQVATQGHFGGLSEPPQYRGLIEVPRPCDGDIPEFGGVRGFRAERLTPLGAETWAYDGSLALPAPVWLRAKLVVRGSFSCPAGSLIDDDVKSGAGIRIGSGSVVAGTLTARGELTLENDCLFEGTLRAGLALRLSSGVRGFREGAPVEAESRENLLMEPNVIVRGRLAGSTGVYSAQTALEGGLELLLAEG